MMQARRYYAALARWLTPVRFFVVTATVFGLGFLLLTPPFQGSDEPLHFYRAYQISQGNLVVDRNEGNDSGGVLPVSLQQTVQLTTNNSSLGNLAPSARYDLHTTSEALGISEDPTNATWINFTATALYAPVAYIPQATGVLAARLAHAPPLAMMYAGRLLNLVAWIVLIAVAIRLMPYKKWAVAAVGLIPVALSQAASLSADSMTIGLCALFVATVFYLREQKKLVTTKQLAGVLALLCALVLCKQIMVVFLPLLLLVPNRLFTTKKMALVTKTILGLVPIGVYGLWLLVIKSVDMKSVFSHNQDPPAQIAYMLHHPFDFVATLWNTHFSTVGDAITRSFIGTFGWGDVGLSEWLVTLAYVGLFVLLFALPTGKFKIWISTGQRWFLAAMSVAYAVAISAALYAYYNPVGAHVINGIQGRYLLPLAFLAIPLCYGSWLRISPRAYRIVAVAMPVVVLVASMIVLLQRYYFGAP